MASKFTARINYDPGPWYCGETEPDWDAEIERLEAVNAQLLEALRLTEPVIPEDFMVYSEGDHGDRIYVRDVVHAAIKAATEG